MTILSGIALYFLVDVVFFRYLLTFLEFKLKLETDPKKEIFFS
jgi:hypothetical protein